MPHRINYITILFAIVFLSWSLGHPTSAEAQAARGLGAGALILDDGHGNTITLETPLGLTGSYIYTLPPPPGGSITSGYVQMGSSTGQTLYWNGAYWAPSSYLFNTGTGLSFTGNLSANGGTGSIGQVLTINGSGNPIWSSVAGTGTVTSVGVSGGSTGLTTSGGPIMGAGTITLAGTLVESNGGTHQSSYATGDILYASSANTLSKLTIGSTNQVLTVSGGVPTWATGGGGGMSNPMTTLGDMIYEDATPTPNRVAGNTTITKKFLSQTGTGTISAAPVWGILASADIPNNAANTSGNAGNVTGTVAIGNGGTGQITQQTAIDALSGGITAGSYLRGNGTHVVLSPIQASDVPTLNQNTTGNAATVTNGVYTTGSYSDPSWITSLSGGKITGNISGNAAGFTGSLGGDVTGSQSSTTVGKLQGVAVSSSAPGSGQALVYNGTQWAPGSPSGFTGSLGGDVTGSQASTTVGKLQGVAVSNTAPGSGQALVYNGTQWAPGLPSGFTGSLGGDVTGSQSSTTVGKLQGVAVSNTAPGSGQALVYNGTQWTPGLPSGFTGSLGGDVTGSQSSTTVGKLQGVPVSNTAPTDGQALVYHSGSGSWSPTPLGGTGTVTSVDVSGGSTGLTTSGGPVTTSGTITLAGTLDETNGGTNQTTYSTGDLLYASAANTLSKLAIGSTNQVLSVSGGIPVWVTGGGGGMSNPMTTLGDIIYEDATPTPNRVAGNTTTTKKFLTQTGNGTISASPAWGILASGDIPNNAANTSGTASGFTGSLSGDVTGTQSATVVSLVGGSSAANVHSAELAANAATNANTTSTIVKRDASGNFSAGTITANLSGNATTATTATNFSGSLSGDVTGTQGATVVSLVGGSSAANVHSAELAANAATNANTASTIVKRDASGNFSAGTITANLSGNATTATTATNFSGSLSGDVTGTQGATVVSLVGGSSAANVHSAELAANAATNANTASTIVKRDASGNFSAGTITANLSGNATTATTATNFSGSLSGDVTGTQGATVVSLVGGSSAANVHSAELAANAATNANTASTIVKRDASGNFSAGTITANLSGNATTATTATNFSASLSGDVTGTQGATVVSLVGGSSAANVHSAELAANAATNANTASTIVKRDASGNFSAGTITASLTGNASGTAANVTGTVAVANGGTGITSYTTGDILYASNSSTLSKLSVGTNGYVLTLSGGLPAWEASGGGGGGWGLTGNSGTTYKTNFIGTTDNIDLQFRIDNNQAGLIETDETGNTGLGYLVLHSNVSGQYNTAIGDNALTLNTASNNTAFGDYTLVSNTSGSDNTAIGSSALNANQTGSENVAVGELALADNTSGSNTAVGNGALSMNEEGSANTAVGNYTLSTNISGSFNTAIGTNADVQEDEITNATAIGYGAIVNASNTIQLGNTNVSAVNTYGALTVMQNSVPQGLYINNTTGTGIDAGGNAWTIDYLGDMDIDGSLVGANAVFTPSTTDAIDINNSNSGTNDISATNWYVTQPGDAIFNTLGLNSGSYNTDGVFYYDGPALETTGAGTATTVLHGSGGGAPAYSSIVDGDVDNNAGIQGTKIHPDFGTQEIVTTNDIVSSSGSIGIGTSSPSQALEVKDGSILLSNSGTAQQLKFQGTGSGLSTLQAGAQSSTTINYTLPTSQPSTNQVLSATAVSGSGPYAVTLGWAAAGGGSGWSTSGNSLTGSEVLGSTNAQPLVIETNGTERMRVLSGGNVGVNSTNPSALFEVDNGALLASGTTGTTPVSGAGTRMMWVPALGAFRAGTASSTEWDNANIGTNSVALGYLVKASGSNSVAIGADNSATAGYAFAAGYACAANGTNSAAIGNNSTATTTNSVAIGTSDYASGSNSLALGTSSEATGDHAIAIGYNTVSDGSYSYALGYSAGNGSNSRSFAYSDGSATTTNDAANQFLVRASGGFKLFDGTGSTATLQLSGGNLLLSNGGTAGQVQLKGTSSGLSTFQSGAQGSTTINYTLPTSQPSANQVLSATAISGSGPYAVTLGWAAAGGAPLFAMKSSSQDYSSVNLANDNDITLSLAASATYVFDAFLSFTDVNQDISLGGKIAFTVPSGTTLKFGANSAGGPFSGSKSVVSGGGTALTAIVIENGNTGDENLVEVKGMVITGSTSGNLQLQCAKGNGTTLRLQPDSYITATRVQ